MALGSRPTVASGPSSPRLFRTAQRVSATAHETFVALRAIADAAFAPGWPASAGVLRPETCAGTSAPL